MDFELKKRHKGRINIWYGRLPSDFASGLAGSYTNVVSGSFADNSLVIRDTVTPANNYNGPLITNGVFNKFTYSRASTATFVGSNGLIQTAGVNVPRIHYDPVFPAWLGYLHEGARTNLCLQSEDFATTWTPQNSVVSVNAINGPDGVLSAELVTDNGTANTNYGVVQTGIAIAASSTYTFTVFLKKRDYRYAQINVNTTTDRYAFFDLDTGATSGGSGIVSASMVNAGNGWWRCVLVITSAVGQIAATANIFYTDSSATSAHVGVIGTGTYFYGAQLELGGAASSYIPTTTVAVTRAGDSLSLGAAAFNLSATAGTFVFHGSSKNNNSFTWELDNGSSNRTTNIVFSGVPSLYVDSGGANQVNLGDGAVTDGVTFKTASAWAANDFALSRDGRAVVTDTSGLVSVGMTTLRLGNDDSGGSHINDTIIDFTYIAERIANADLVLRSAP